MQVIYLSFRVYLKNGWNKLDLLIVVTSILDIGLTYGLAGQGADLSMLKIFRIFRCDVVQNCLCFYVLSSCSRFPQSLNVFLPLHAPEVSMLKTYCVVG